MTVASPKKTHPAMNHQSVSRTDSLVSLAAGVPTVLLCAVVLAGYIYPQGMPPINYIRNLYNNTYEYDGKSFHYDQNMPLIFIGGMPRSGTTLMRAILDAHTMVRCGEETHVLPKVLGFREMWYRQDVERAKLEDTHLTDDIMRAAFASFLLEVIVRHGEPAERLCNKDPFLMRSAAYITEIFPNAKFLFVVRDGRAVVHSIMTRKVVISDYKLDDYNDVMSKWNKSVADMLIACRKVGPKSCLIVYYEQLVLHPRMWIEHIAKFANLPWEENMLRHEDFFGIPGGISVSPTERSTDQIIKPINKDALSKWVGAIPDDMARQMSTMAPMLTVLGYNSDVELADYSAPFTSGDAQFSDGQDATPDLWLSNAINLVQSVE